MQKTVKIITRLVYETLDKYEYIVGMLSVSQLLILLSYALAIVLPLIIVSYYKCLGYLCDGLIIFLEVTIQSVILLWLIFQFKLRRLRRRLIRLI